jgi:hypothetical protein
MMKSVTAFIMGRVLAGPAVAWDRVQGVPDALRAEHGFSGGFGCSSDCIADRPSKGSL